MTDTTTKTHDTSPEAPSAQLNTAKGPTRPIAASMPPTPAAQDERLKRPLNSKRSGGPRSSEGRARCSLNAIKHGGYVTASSAALEYEQILSELTARVNPIGRVEEGLAESLAVELLLLSTLGKLEVERLQSAVNSEVSSLELAQALDYPQSSTHTDNLRNPPRSSSLQAQCLPSPSDAESRWRTLPLTLRMTTRTTASQSPPTLTTYTCTCVPLRAGTRSSATADGTARRSAASVRLLTASQLLTHQDNTSRAVILADGLRAHKRWRAASTRPSCLAA